MDSNHHFRIVAVKRTSVASAARRVKARLRSLADPAVAAQGRSFFKQPTEIRLYGVRAAAVRTLADELHREVRGSWDVTIAQDFCDRMIREPELEAKVVGIFLLGRYAKNLDHTALHPIAAWIEQMHCANWAAIDTLAPSLITPVVQSYPQVLPQVVGWADSHNMWLRRAAVVTFVPLARRGLHLGTAYGLVDSLNEDEEDLMHKACGWLLREAGKTDMPRLERFLLRRGRRLPRTTVRYAIERFPEKQRKRLLAETKT
jgi:3-methyladenine DNA glycosylase AlkD